MKKIIFIIIPLFICATCAPSIDYYRPIDNISKYLYKDNHQIHAVLYGPLHIDSLNIYSSITTGSFQKIKNLGAVLVISNHYKKPYSINTKNLYITSSRLDTIKYNEIDGTQEHFHQPYDSIVYRFGKEYQINDFNWYRKMKKTDTLFLNFELNDKKIQIPFYFKKKNSLETYPY